MIRAVKVNDWTFVCGPAGTGKTHCAVGLAVQALRTNEIEKIVISRPLVQVGRSMGHLPGSMDEKLSPFVRPCFDELSHYLSHSFLKQLFISGVIEVAPLTYIQGRTFNDSYIILDEAQNATDEELKYLLSRLGENSKMILVGDPEQCVLPINERGALTDIIIKLKDMLGVGVITMGLDDIVRHSRIGELLRRLG